MATYRYARDSKTSAQKAAAKWQRQVDAKRALLADLHVTLNDYNMRRYKNIQAQLDRLLAENPNEPI